MSPHTDSQARVAIVGSGLAGLVAAYLLHNEPKSKYRVTLFESKDQISLGSASVLLQDKSGQQELVDVPMRSFAPGYYYNLKSMYDFLGIQYRAERFLFAFSRDAGCTKDPALSYYIHASNRHRIIPPRPFGKSFVEHGVHIFSLALCYLWLSICCFVIAPLEDETLDRYLQRVRIPLYFTSGYLLPLISSVATCSHEALLNSPAHDFVAYKRRLYRNDHYTVETGSWGVEQRLLRGVDVRLSSKIEEVKSVPGGVRLRWRAIGTEDLTSNHTDVFDNVVLAIPPNVIARIFTPLRDIMSLIPTVEVQSFIIQPRNGRPRLSISDVDRAITTHPRYVAPSTRFVSLRSHSDPNSWTATYQSLSSGAYVATNSKEIFDEDSIIAGARFTRVLRTITSRKLVNQILGEDDSSRAHFQTNWRNGDSGVWVAGAWCWDGMVLLEGCVVSAMRIAEGMDVEIPWASTFRTAKG